MTQKQLILASSSPHRARALRTLGIEFEVSAPNVDESPVAGESAEHLSQRLSLSKAQTVQTKFPLAVVIGSDQVGMCEGQMLGKPGSIEAARSQLEFLSGKTAQFFTSLSVVSPTMSPCNGCTMTELRFRPITRATAQAYVEIDSPLDCAGSFKSESLGIALFEWIRSSDPTALVGLPMIALVTALHSAGINPIAHPY